MQLHVFDIETIPQSAARLSAIEPEHEAPGNIKDPDKIRAAIAEKAAKWRQRAALDATTGRVAMIGVYTQGRYEISRIQSGWDDDHMLDCHEATMLDVFWSGIDSVFGRGDMMAGFNCFGFDLPFLIQRSWILNVPISAHIDLMGRGFKLPWIDLMRMWAGYNQFISLDTVSKALGLPGKNGDPTELPMLLRHEPEKAIAYLQNDLSLTHAVAERMGICRVTQAKPMSAVELAASNPTDY